MKIEQLHRGLVCRHHSGRVYTVMAITNASDRQDFPMTVCYVGANGALWSRPTKDFVEKFSILFDGTTLAPEPK